MSVCLLSVCLSVCPSDSYIDFYVHISILRRNSTKRKNKNQKNSVHLNLLHGMHAQLTMFTSLPDMSPEVHCNLCNKCYILGMPGPRPDIRCVQFLSKVHPKVPIEFLVPSGASEVID
jgi:hypothetical protein